MCLCVADISPFLLAVCIALVAASVVGCGEDEGSDDPPIPGDTYAGTDTLGSFDVTVDIPIDRGADLEPDPREDVEPLDVHDVGDDDANWSDVADAPSARTIDENGGSIETDFARLIVPPGAVRTAVEFELVRDTPDVLPFPDDFRVASSMVGFLPEGQTFDVPVTVAIRSPEADVRMQIWWSPISLVFWRSLDTELDGQWATAQVEHFSRGFVGRPEAAFCGDGVAEDAEDCDGDDLRGLDCTEFGLLGDALACTDACELDASRCEDPCEGVVCDTPPVPICRTDVGVHFEEPVACVGGECVWTERSEDCGRDACAGGMCVNTPDYGDVIVTEFMVNPDGDDARFEWFELLNVRPREIYVGGMAITDDGTDRVVLPDGVSLAPGARLVVAASIWATPGIESIDWSALGTFELNSSDVIELTYSDRRIDRVFYDRDWSILPAVAQSLTVRVIDADGNDDPAAWCGALSGYGVASNLGSPGAPNPVCAACGNGVVEPPEECDDGNTDSGDGCDETCVAEPDLCGGIICLEPPPVECASDVEVRDWIGVCVPATGECRYDPVDTLCADDGVCLDGVCRPAIAVGDVIVSEFMPIPIGGVSEQWFELTSFSDVPIELGGMEITGATISDRFIVPPGAILSPRGALVFGASRDAAGGVAAVIWTEHGSFGLSDAGDVIELTYGGRRVHRVEYDPTWPLFLSASVQREDTKPPEEVETSNGWCLPALLYDLAGNSGSPRNPVHDCPLCGNDAVEDGEECDDGNTDDGDGCDADCQREGD